MGYRDALGQMRIRAVTDRLVSPHVSAWRRTAGAPPHCPLQYGLRFHRWPDTGLTLEDHSVENLMCTAELYLPVSLIAELRVLSREVMRWMAKKDAVQPNEME